MRECGSACSVLLTFGRCGAYAADPDADSTAAGWAEAYASSDDARQQALAECHSRGGGSGCIVRVWGCNGPVVKEELNLERAARRQIQRGLRATGFNPRQRGWRGTRATGYLDGAAADVRRSAAVSGPAVALSAPPAVATGQQPSSSGAPAAAATATAEFGGSALAVNHEQHGDARWRPGTVFRDCDVYPEDVVMPGGDLALGRYEVTLLGEYLGVYLGKGKVRNVRQDARLVTEERTGKCGKKRLDTWSSIAARAIAIGGFVAIPTRPESAHD